MHVKLYIVLFGYTRVVLNFIVHLIQAVNYNIILFYTYPMEFFQ